MTSFNNLKIAYKIAVLMLLLGAVTLGIAINGATSLRKVDAGFTALAGTTLPNNTELARTNQGVIDIVYSAYQMSAYPPRSEQSRAAAAHEKEAFEEARKRLEGIVKLEPEMAAEINPLIRQLDELNDLVSEAIKLSMADRGEEARAAMVPADAKALAIRADLRRITNARAEAAVAETHALDEMTKRTVTTMLAIGLIGVVAAVGFGIFIARRTIIAPLARLEETMRALAGGNNNVDVDGSERRDEVGEMARAVLVFRDNAQEQARGQAAKAIADAEQKKVIDTVSAHLEALAQGDLSRPITAEFSGAYLALKDNFNGAITSLRSLIQSVMESVRSISSGSSEIEAASEDLARRTESAAASLEETSAAIAQINDRLRTGAESATRTVGRADQAIVTVGTGRGTAEEAVGAMGRVAESAKGIDSVIEGLDKIAFQTRVLAMNAAVEAGRAGEAGRGFAVVADLVGQLAMRSEEEAKRAREQLTTTQNDVELAVGAVERVDGALVGISSDVAAVHELLSAMAQDNQAQAAAVQQIASAIATMDESTQQNAAMVEQTSAAARSLNSEVRVLGDRADTFRTGDTAPGRASAPVRHAPPVAKQIVKASPPSKAPGTVQAPAAKPPSPANNGDVATANDRAYQSPIKPLAAGAVTALARKNDEWDEF